MGIDIRLPIGMLFTAIRLILSSFGAVSDRAATFLHDIGLHFVKSEAGETGIRVIVGGGMGRTPIIGHVIREFLPWQPMLTYCEAILEAKRQG